MARIQKRKQSILHSYSVTGRIDLLTRFGTVTCRGGMPPSGPDLFAVRHVMKRAVVVLIACTLGAVSILTCTKSMREPRPSFHLVAPCSISGLNVLARTNTSSAKRCSQFAALKQGLAFNFKPAGKKRSTSENCLVYDCPESEVLQSIQRERDFDYYSLYADPLPSEDTICLVNVGIFRVHEDRANYTEAMKTCRDEGGELASILSAKRTEGLSNMVSNLKHHVREAYVGLDDIENEGKFMTASGKMASCYEYRSWGLGEPKSRRTEEDCVVIDGGKNWKVVDCRKRLPFICELLPKGPFPLRGDDGVDDLCQVDLSNRRLIKRISKTKNFYKNSIAFHWISNFFKI